jgi:hypothetical protein
MSQGAIGQLYERFLGLPVLVVLVALWVVGWALWGLCALASYLLWGCSEVDLERGTVGQEDEGPWAPWKEAGSRGLDTWFELPAGHDDAMAKGFCGEPGGVYVHSSVVEDYLATLEGQEAHEEGYDDHYYAWLKYVLRRLEQLS